MTKKTVDLVLMIVLLKFLAGGISFGQPTGKIFDPVVTGSPPDNAFNGMVILPDGEIRHFGFEGAWFLPSAYIYIYSHDNGLSWNKKTINDPDLFANENMPPAVRSPWSGDYLRLIGKPDGTWLLRSTSGIDGPYVKTKIDSSRRDMFRQPVFLSAVKRILVTCGMSMIRDGIEVMQSCVYYSDDDGHTWDCSLVPVGPVFYPVIPNLKPRWQNYAIEPAITELDDGRIWMLLRTSMDNLYESFSNDHGASWSAPVPSGFTSTLTMPSFLRLKDHRLLLFFCDTYPLPEEDRSSDTTISGDQKNGLWEDVFTNRDAIHAAISDDDGKTWKGFRELYLNPLRNESDFAVRGGKEVSLDKSVHQSQAVELPDHNVLVALGQHPLVRKLIIFNPDWLYETTRADSFQNGLTDWSTFKYIRGIKGHCAYNRFPGPELTKDPVNKEKNVLQIRHLPDKNLVCDIDGAVWNFPAAASGSVTIRIYPEINGKGGSVFLTDRWFNPSDTTVCHHAVFKLNFDGNGKTDLGKIFHPGSWAELTLIWTDLRSGKCSVKVDGKAIKGTIPLNNPSFNGINYIHFQSASNEYDNKGFLVGSVKAVSDKY